MTTAEDKRATLRRAALEYHEFPTPGKVASWPGACTVPLIFLNQAAGRPHQV